MARILGASRSCHCELSNKLQGKGGNRRPVYVAIHYFPDLFDMDHATSTPVETLARSLFRTKFVNSLFVETASTIRLPSSPDSEAALMSLHRKPVVYCSDRMNKIKNAAIGTSTNTEVQIDNEKTYLSRFMRLDVFFN